LPWIYGDAMDIPAAHTPRQHSELAQQQLANLERWATGDFDATDPDPVPVIDLAILPVAEQPPMLDRSALEFCLADAFHPGCEMTWPVRHASMYMAPYRILHRASNEPDPVYGDTLTPAEVLESGGLLYGQRPGWLTRWMAVPWHSDTASCRSGYDVTYDQHLPTFWPARVPNQVLTEADYHTIMTSSDPAVRQAAFEHRSDWDENGLGDADYMTQVRKMPALFGEMGLVEVRAGPSGDPAIPPVIMVADRPLIATAAPAAAMVGAPSRSLAEKRAGNWLNRFGRYPRGLSAR